MPYMNKQVTVFGLHRSGVAAAKLLHKLGVHVRVTDAAPKEKLQADVQALNDIPVEFWLGGHESGCIEGVDLIVLSPGVPLDIPILQRARQMGIPMVSELEVAASVCAAPIVAITGTKGKSTTTTLISELAQHGRFRRVCTAGNIGIPLSAEALNLTPEDLVVAEVSSFQLETTATFRPRISVALNLSRDHLDRHGTMAAYRAAKLKICANQRSTDWIVLNAADTAVAGFASETNAQAMFFSDVETLQNGACLRDDAVVVSCDGETYEVCKRSDIRLLGRHNLQNVLAAVAVGHLLALSPDTMRAAIRGFSASDYPALEHAFELVAAVNGVRYINDSKATNVAAVKAALASLDAPILLIMGGYDKGNDYAPLVALVREKVKGLILLGEHTQIIRNALARHVVTWDAATMGIAVNIAKTDAKPGDVVLLSPANASFDMFTDYKARGQAFRKAVIEIESATMGTDTKLAQSGSERASAAANNREP